MFGGRFSQVAPKTAPAKKVNLEKTPHGASQNRKHAPAREKKSVNRQKRGHSSARSIRMSSKSMVLESAWQKKRPRYGEKMKPRKRRQFLIKSARAMFGFSLLSLAGCSTASRKPTASRDVFMESLVSDWEQAIPQWLQETKVPGVSIAIIRYGKLAWRRGFGVEDTGTNKPVDNKSVFAACSNTKPVFAYAVAKLCEKGVMDLDTPLTRYTSERIIPDPRLEMITARHVLTHTTGFPNWRQEPEPLTLQFTPGEKYQYSGEGFSYLQSVVTRLTGKSFEVFMRDNILVPFGMTSSRCSWDMAYARQLAKPHDKAGKRIPGKYFTLPSAEEKARNLDRYGAAACLMTTPTDYAKFLLEILNPKPADAFRLSETGLRE